MTKFLKTRLAVFRREEDASMTVEAVIMIPVLLWAFVSMFIFFDYFKAQSSAQKAAFTIGDMISRETDYINPTYISGARDLMALLSDTPKDDTSLRVTVVKYNATEDRYQRVWSRVRGSQFVGLTNTDVKKMSNQLPVMVHNEQLILIETHTQYDQFSNIGLLDDSVQTFVFTRPRFAPQVLWTHEI